MWRCCSKALLMAFAPLMLVGCADNPMVLQSQLQTLQQQQMTLAQENQELRGRAATLDRDNQELEQMLAQQRQKGLVNEEQVAALRDQLRSTTAQLAQVKQQSEELSQQAETMMASTRKRVGTSITANSSLRRNLPAINIKDIEVRNDGDVVRIELPGDKLFMTGAAQLQPGASQMIETVTQEITQVYPNHFIGIEGHTDSDPINGAAWANNHQLSVARAMTVYNLLTTRTMIKPDQLFVVGHGSNHPVVSNATPEGKARNRRVELVIYPERTDGR